MLKRAAFLLLATLFATACSQAAAEAQQETPVVKALVPRGAKIGPGGFATILDAPPAPFTPTEPNPAPVPRTPERIAADRQFLRVTQFQNRVRDEVQALADKLRSAEKGNFVDLYFENEGDPHVVFRFLRNGHETLAKYTHNPKFVAATTRYSNEELRAAIDFMWKTFAEDRVIAGGGTGNKQNRAEVEINVTEAEFQALVAKKGVKIPEAVELKFQANEPASAINRPPPPNITALVRIFPRSDRPLGILNAILSRAKVVLKDGCFRVQGGEHDQALVLFPLGAQLFIDREGYLAYGTAEAPGYARVGEEIVTPGSIAELTAVDIVEPIHAACGPGKVVNINGMQSAAADRAEYSVTSNANSLRQLKSMYGLSEPAARKALEACKKSFGMGTCVLSPPPPMRREDCPAGTSFSSGLCRTPEGYLRPLPKWLQDYAD